MGILTKVNASVITYRRKVSDGYNDTFYMNGRFINEVDTESVQASIEGSSSEFIFAVSSGMIEDPPKKNLSISITKELKKFQENSHGNSKDINTRIGELKERVSETDNLVHSLSIGSAGEKNGKTSFAGLIIHQGKAGIVNSGRSRIYLLRGGTIKQLPVDYRKADRLLKAGIITSEQADELIEHLAMTSDESKVQAKKEEIISIEPGDMFLLCTGRLADTVNDDVFGEIFTSHSESSIICSTMAKEALKKDVAGDITVMAVKVDGVDGNYTEDDDNDNDNEVEKAYTTSSIDNNMKRVSRNRIARKIVPVIVSFLLFAGVVFGAYKLLDRIGREGLDEVLIPSAGDAISGTNDDIAAGEDDGNSVNNGNEETTDTAGDSQGGQGVSEPSEGDSDSDNDGEEPVYYTVESGDNLGKISMKYYNTPDKYKLIMDANGIKNPNQLQIGQKLLIPKDK